MKHVILRLIRIYQRYISFGNSCRFTPSCSEYTYQAVEAYGIIDGLFLGVKRILRCHPWSKGGYDPLPL